MSDLLETEYCVWLFQGAGMYDTGCDRTFLFEDPLSSPSGLEMAYCPFCGMLIAEGEQGEV